MNVNQLILLLYRMGEQRLNNIKVIEYNIRKSSIPLIIFFIIVIINYCYSEFYLLDLQEQLIPSAYSQLSCKPYHISLTNPVKFQLVHYPFKFIEVPAVRDDLLNIKITANPTTKICYNPIAKEYYTADLSPLTLEINSTILNLKNKFDLDSGKLNLQDTPMIELIGGEDGILDPLQSSTCPTKATDSQNPFICSRNKTKLNITENDQNLILGASKKNPNGIVIISQIPKDTKNDPPEPAKISACDKNELTKYVLPQDSVIEIDCK